MRRERGNELTRSNNSVDLFIWPSKLRSMKKAAGIPVLVNADNSSSTLERVFLGAGTHDENWLQRLIFEHPDLLPVSQIEPGFGKVIPAAREVACGHGYIDNLYVTPSGEIVLVETKLWRNVQARRELVAQALDYVSSLMTMGYEGLEAAVLKAGGVKTKTLYALVSDQPDALDTAAFIDAISSNLARGRMLVIALGDGIRQEAEALVELLQGHVGAHFTFALVELTVWRKGGSDELLIIPNTLAQTVMIERGILAFENGAAQIKPVPVQHQKPAETLSEAMFFEGLAKIEPGLPAALRAFLARLEPLGVYPDLKAAMNLKVDLPDRPKPTNFGYIAKNGQLWTNPLGYAAPSNIAREYNRRLAELIGGSVSEGTEINLTIDGKAAPKVNVLLPHHAQGWEDAIAWAIQALREQDIVGAP
jgi:hypothetical protein